MGTLEEEKAGVREIDLLGSRHYEARIEEITAPNWKNASVMRFFGHRLEELGGGKNGEGVKAVAIAESL